MTYSKKFTKMSDKKKIKDTALGAWLTAKVPALADKVGDLLPDSGVLGVVKTSLTKSLMCLWRTSWSLKS